jgi:hypothetical protein
VNDVAYEIVELMARPQNDETNFMSKLIIQEFVAVVR